MQLSLSDKHIEKSHEAPNPYRSGYTAKPAIWMRTILGDRVWDKVVMMF